MPPAKALIVPGSWMSAATELRGPALPEGGHALGQVGARPGPGEGGVDVGVGDGPVQRQLVAGDRDGRQAGDLTGPGQGVVEPPYALNQPDAVGLFPAEDLRR